MENQQIIYKIRSKVYTDVGFPDTRHLTHDSWFTGHKTYEGTSARLTHDMVSRLAHDTVT